MNCTCTLSKLRPTAWCLMDACPQIEPGTSNAQRWKALGTKPYSTGPQAACLCQQRTRTHCKHCPRRAHFKRAFTAAHGLWSTCIQFRSPNGTGSVHMLPQQAVRSAYLAIPNICLHSCGRPGAAIPWLQPPTGKWSPSVQGSASVLFLYRKCLRFRA